MILKEKFRANLFFELCILCSMLITLIIPSVPTSIASWAEISPLLFVRASVWLIGLSLLPGFYVLRLTALGENLSKLEKIIIGINLSFVLLGLTSVVLYYLQGSLRLLPWLLLSTLIVLVCGNWFKFKVNRLVEKTEISKWNLLLICGILTTIVLAFYFQLGQRYQLPGDVWVSSEPAVQIISQRNVYEFFRPSLYPLMFGHILAGLSICCGLPIINTYVTLFPLAALNILSFFIFTKNVFNMNDKVATLASLIYGFGAGLGLIIQFLGYGGTLDFLSLSSLTSDFSMPNTYTILFYHKSLALTQTYTSIVCLMIATKLEKTSSKIFAIIISVLLFLFSFYIHMIEAMIFIPLILLVSYMHEKKGHRIYIFGFYIVITLLIALIMDFFMEGYYFWLTFYKISAVLSIVGIDKILIYLLPLLGGAFLAAIVRFFLSNKLGKFRISKNHLGMIKVILASSLLVIYVCGLWFWNIPTPQDSFPWYRYVTCYGIIGVLALIGVAESNWRKKEFLIASFWSLYIILLGKVWWESRISTYLTPIIVIFASTGIFEIWKKADRSTYTKVNTSENTIGKTLRLNPKRAHTITAALIVGILFFSTISTIYGATNYYGWNNPCVSDDVARAFAWINENIAENTTVLVPDIYNIYKGVQTISDREIYLSKNLSTTIDANFIETLDNYNIKYAVTFENEDEISPVLRVLLSYSTLAFHSGDVKVFRLPDFQPPSSKKYSVAMVDKQLLGFLGNPQDLGWIDDNFEEKWTYKNVNASSNGEVLTFEWQLHKLYESEPYAIRSIPPVDSNKYPYLIVKYRNTPARAESVQVTQIVTLINETGYPEGALGFYLPYSEEETFQIFTAKLPVNQTVAQIWIWMRNWGTPNGSVCLQVDYIGFTSLEIASELRLRFLSAALPALWPMNYSVFSNFGDVGNASILVSTYDRSIPNQVAEATNVKTFVFFNLTATFPLWGSGWRNVNPGIISGSLDGKKVVIVGIELFVEKNLVNLAESIYEEIK